MEEQTTFHLFQIKWVLFVCVCCVFELYNSHTHTHTQREKEREYLWLIVKSLITHSYSHILTHNSHTQFTDVKMMIHSLIDYWLFIHSLTHWHDDLKWQNGVCMIVGEVDFGPSPSSTSIVQIELSINLINQFCWLINQYRFDWIVSFLTYYLSLSSQSQIKSEREREIHTIHMNTHTQSQSHSLFFSIVFVDIW
jgi:hypothetical protein